MTFTHLKVAATIPALLLIAAEALAGPWQPGTRPLPRVVVEATYPGADAAVLADTVAAPIEEQMNGVLDVVHLASRCGNDGRYVLEVTFKPGTDLDIHMVLVQNRVALALPVLPEAVMREGVTVKKMAPLLLLVNLSSPTGRYDMHYLRNHATSKPTEELARLPGVGAVTVFGRRDAGMRVWLDPEKMAARNLTAVDVIQAIQQQNVQIGADRIDRPQRGEEIPYVLDAAGRLTEPEAFAEIVLATRPDGKLLRLKEVGRVERGAADGDARVNGKPGVLLVVHPTGSAEAKKVSRAVADKLATLRARLPEGLSLEVAFDATTNPEAPDQPASPTYLLLDLDLPHGASADRIGASLTSCETLLREVGGIQDVITLTGNPFDLLRTQPCILVRLAPAGPRQVARDEIVRTIRAKLDKVPDTAIRLRDLSRPGGYGYPIDLAVTGPDAAHVRALCQKLGERLRMNKQLTDVAVDPRSRLRSHLQFDIDGTRARTLGVAVPDIVRTIETSLGAAYIDSVTESGRTWRVVVSAEVKPDRPAKDVLKMLMVRNDRDQMVPLGSMVEVRTLGAPAVIYRIDSRPAIYLTTNPAAGVSLQEARAACEAQFEEARRELRLPATYRLMGLHQDAASR